MARSLDLLLFAVVTVSTASSFTGVHDRIRRADNITSMEHVIDQLVRKVNSLEAGHIALHTQVIDLQNKVASMRCESGKLGFSPGQSQNRTVQTNGEVKLLNTQHIAFARPFVENPVLTAGITHIDGDNRHVVKIDVDVTHVQLDGADITVSEWVDASSFGLTVMWMACSR